MKFNFKKVASVLASAVMLTSTIGFAAATNYPSPFTEGAAVVYGANAAATDMSAAIDVYRYLKGLEKTSTTTTSSVSGGESTSLATSSQNIFFNSTLNSAKITLTKSELPTVLKDSSVIDDDGTSYTYTQSIKLGSRRIAYSTSGNDFQDPELIVDLGYSSTDPIYNYTVTFNKNINITSSKVQGNDIELLGKKFTIGASSSLATSGSEVLELYGAGESITVNEGEEKTVTIGDKTYTIKVAGITQSSGVDKVSVSVDGGTIREINEGSSAKVGGLEIYAKTVFYSAKESSANYATLNIGSEKLKLQNGQTVYKGTDETAVQNTKVSLSVSNGLLSSINIAVSTKDSSKDYIEVGESFSDPIFGGLKITFANVNPSLTSANRDKVVIDTDNIRSARVTFTSALAGEEKTFTWLYDTDTSDSTVTPLLVGDTSATNGTLHVKEGEGVKQNEYVVVNAGDYGRILKLSVSSGSSQECGVIKFTDALTNTEVFGSTGLSVGTSCNATTNIDGQTYYFRLNNVSASDTSTWSVNVTWGSGASYNNPGTQTTLFPRIKLKNGEWMAFLAPTTVSNSTTYVLPGTENYATYESGVSLGNLATGSGQRTSVKVGNINYSLLYSSLTTAVIDGIDVNNDGSVDCNFTSTQGGAIVFIEEKKTTESGNSDNGDAICVAADSTGTTTPVEISVAQPKVTGVWSDLQSFSSDSYQQAGVTRYGTFVKYNSQDNDKVEIYYPDEQMVAEVLFASEAATITPGTEAVATGKIEIFKDTEADSFRDRHLIVIGGSCINQVAAKILDSDVPLCGDDFTAKTRVSAGGYIIKVVESPYNDKKIAMLVAGYHAADTQNAVRALSTTTRTDKGTEETYPVVSTTTTA